MAALVYVVLAHEAAEQLISLGDLLLGADQSGQVVIHYDAKSPQSEFDKLQTGLRDVERVHLVPDRIVCGWGQFSLVDSVTRALRLIRAKDLSCDHVYLLSGSCRPVRPLAQLKRFLDRHPDLELIEAQPSSWMVGGLREERYQYHHWFSHLSQRKLFDLSVKYQRRLGIKRRFPKGLTPRFGAQWWCLTTKTCYAILDYIDQNPDHYRFFRTTWIPDELFFQTMAFHLCGAGNILNRSPTFYEFSDRGKPTVFFDDSIEMMRGLPYFFARKISWRAKQLQKFLSEVAAGGDDGGPLPVSGELPVGFSFRERVARQTEFPRPGQLFYGDQLAGSWPGALGSSKTSFGVLYGPPALTGMAIEALRQVPGLTLFGRVFKPDEVDFGPAGHEFEGLRPDDIHIRAMDRPLYLSRILERAAGFPIIQMCPGDDRDAEGALWHFPRAVFMPCVPRRFALEEWQTLYWALTALANPKSRLRHLDHREVAAGNYHLLGAVIQKHIEEFTATAHREWVVAHVIDDRRDKRAIRLLFDTESQHPPDQRRRRQREENLRTALRSAGPKILPLFEVLDHLESRFAALHPESILDLLPNAWRTYFRALFEPLRGRPTVIESPQLSIVELAANGED